MNNQPRSRKKPNFLVILVDEERYPPIYENAEIKQWSKENLVAQQFLRKSHSMEFHRHYIGSAACCPSRATLMTGQYPSLHGVSQTTGIAKEPFDSDMFWLGSNTVPTLGNYFREAGYQTYYKGKWHFSYQDIIIPGTHQSVLSYSPENGIPDREREGLYLHANRMDHFGFSGWIGPEPHGRDPRNSGSSAAIGLSGRDIVYASEVVSLIQALADEKERNEAAKPWLVVSSFVNPHDIVLYGALAAQLPTFNFDIGPMPPVAPAPTQNEPLDTKPRCQKSYQQIYPRALQPIINEPHYRKLYYHLQKQADMQMQKVLEALAQSSAYDDTIVIFTSDHGDLLGSHGRLHQKFYCTYEEMLHVPLIIHSKQLFPKPEPQPFNTLTSHVDLLPTMLGLAQANVGDIQSRLQKKFSEVHPFVGRDLCSFILGQNTSEPVESPIYFMIDDDVTRGQHQVNPIGIPFLSVVQPNHIETVIAPLYNGNNKQLWKYSRYYDNEQFWSEPGIRDVTFQPTAQHAGITAPGSPSASNICYVAAIKTVPVAEEYELYNLTADPLETRNLAHPAFATEQTKRVQQQMTQLLDEQRQQKRIKPYLTGLSPDEL
ncbi:sulfatase-like hydrolase/transferase [Paenibacillus algorifonticola]|uniref:sulfatase-like hydrolase/transferase n=1 Tax=Paenibacillus algorifonticola TaxID=684063 RepID=UPI003D2E29BE